MIKDLFKLANRLDKLGLRKEADVLDSAIRKLSQTTGNEGSAYNEGREIAGKPGTTVKFYASTPTSITDFNKKLAGLIRDVIQDPYQSIFSTSVKSNIASLESQTSWSAVTNAAFAEYARAAGKSEAGKDWPAFAKANRYAPSLAGVFAFWQDTIDGVINRFNIGEKEDGVLPFAESTEAAGASMATPSANTDPAVQKYINPTPMDLWLIGTFDNDAGTEIWNIPEYDKVQMKDLFGKDTVVQKQLQDLLPKLLSADNEANKKFNYIIEEWYRKNLKDKGIKGWYNPDTEADREIVPINSTVPSPARTKVTASSYNSMIKGIISR